MNKTLVIGLTGQTGSGKSTVCKYLEKKGMFVIDADQVARDVLDEETNCLADIVMEFGCVYLTEQGKLNRKKFGEHVFSDKQALKKLNEIMFPYILYKLKKEIEKSKENNRIIILDAPTLFESGADKFCDKVVSVIAEVGLRKYRIMRRDNITEEHAQDRIKSQHEDDYYREKSWMTIDNSEGLDELEQKINELIYEIKSYEIRS